MAEPVSANIAMLMRVVDRLTPLLDRFVFLGGAVTELFLTAPGAAGPRQTKDVDIVVDLAAASTDLRAYVADRLSEFLALPDADVLVAAQLMPDSDSQDRLPFCARPHSAPDRRRPRLKHLEETSPMPMTMTSGAKQARKESVRALRIRLPCWTDNMTLGWVYQ
ncbi:MAG: hypothetical protein WD060_10320 [Pirellulales bacterium]